MDSQVKIEHQKKAGTPPSPQSSLSPYKTKTVTKPSTQNDSPTPVTPRKRDRNQAQAQAQGEVTMDDTPSKKSKRSNPLGPLPPSYEDASEIDKLIVHLKEKENKSWPEIRKALEEATGATLGSSTVPVRYGRMKANFVVFEKNDEPALLESKKEIEDKFEVEKWQKIADAIEAKRGSKYPSATVQKKFKEMLKKGSTSTVGTNGRHDSPLNDEE